MKTREPEVNKDLQLIYDECFKLIEYDFNVNKRTAKYFLAKAMFYKASRKYRYLFENKKTTLTDMAEFIGYKHCSVVHSYSMWDVYEEFYVGGTLKYLNGYSLKDAYSSLCDILDKKYGIGRIELLIDTRNKYLNLVDEMCEHFKYEDLINNGVNNIRVKYEEV